MTEQNYSPQHYYQPRPHQQQPQTGLGIAGMSCGITAIGLSVIPVLGFLSFLLGPAGIVLGILAVTNDRGRGYGVAGIVTGAAGFVVALVVTLLFFSWLDYNQQMYDRTVRF